MAALYISSGLKRYYWTINYLKFGISWYKKSAGIKTDLTEYRIRNFALQHHFVDVKVCAVTEEWSGLKLVIPFAKR